MMGHKSIIEDKPYITHDTHQISFVAMDFSDVPITSGFYFGHTESAGSLEGGAGAVSYTHLDVYKRQLLSRSKYLM